MQTGHLRSYCTVTPCTTWALSLLVSLIIMKPAAEQKARSLSQQSMTLKSTRTVNYRCICAPKRTGTLLLTFFSSFFSKRNESTSCCNLPRYPVAGIPTHTVRPICTTCIIDVILPPIHYLVTPAGPSVAHMVYRSKMSPARTRPTYYNAQV